MWIFPEERTDVNGFKIAAWVDDEQQFFLIGANTVRDAKLKLLSRINAKIFDSINHGLVKVGTFQRINPDGSIYWTEEKLAALRSV